ncbi:MAG: hypothetical protein Q4D60_03405 [Eubacteriales bacterium]|nr:hypothetical protein [Eubacteriales bacterium]
MTINHGGFTKGRYWVRTEEFSDGKELTDYFYTLDAKINPKSLFTRARSQGREPVEKRK